MTAAAADTINNNNSNNSSSLHKSALVAATAPADGDANPDDVCRADIDEDNDMNVATTTNNNDDNNNNDRAHTILALYKFQLLENVNQVRDEIENLLRRHEALGGILIAAEGINGTICYPNPNNNKCTDPSSTSTSNITTSSDSTTDTNKELQQQQQDEHDESAVVVAAGKWETCAENERGDANDPVYEYLTRMFPGIRTRFSYSHKPVFWRLRVRCKAEIVTLGVPELKTLRLDNNNANNNNDNNVIARDESVENATAAGGGEGGGGGIFYVDPKEWNALIQDPDTWVIDTRNTYEVEVGTFRNAVDPHTTNFTEFPTWLEHQLQNQRTKMSMSDSNNNISNSNHDDLDDGDKNNNNKQQKLPSKIAMFCTGGIRCEKATVLCQQLVHKYLNTDSRKCDDDDDNNKDNNTATTTTTTTKSTTTPLPPVYHLQGGILAYLDQIPEQESLFDGECYVFDQRVAVTHGLRPSSNYQACHACRHPLTVQDRKKKQKDNNEQQQQEEEDKDEQDMIDDVNDNSKILGNDRNNHRFVYGVECPYCANDPEKQARRERYQARQRQMQVAKKLGIAHLGSSASSSAGSSSSSRRNSTTSTTAATTTRASTMSSPTQQQISA